MPRIVSVVFGDGCRVYQFDPGSFELCAGDQVVVETTRGPDFARVVDGSREALEGEAKGSLRRVVRAATAADRERVAANRERERSAVLLARELAAAAGLDMKVVATERPSTAIA